MSFLRVLALCFMFSFTNTLSAAKSLPEAPEMTRSEQELSFQPTDTGAINGLVKNNTTVIDVPDAIVLEPGSFIEWWQFIYALLTPLAIWLFGMWWPSSTKRELITKAMSIAVVILIVVFSVKGFNFATLSQSVMALIMQVFVYDKVYKPLGLNTSKTSKYSQK